MNQQTSAGEDVEKGTPRALLVGMQPGAATVGNSVVLVALLHTCFWS